MAEVLLGAGAQVDTQNNDGKTPLHLAAHRGQTAVAEVLLGAGANVGIQTNGGWTPIQLCGLNCIDDEDKKALNCIDDEDAKFESLMFGRRFEKKKKATFDLLRQHSDAQPKY